MFATARFSIRFFDADTATAPERPVRRKSPVFIGDAVQPWGPDTLLLDLMRRDAESDTDQS
ncbi:hypothetical protein [uncultured Roseobacter sp.]|uniref:hypothetical protein n=1 Tax=uncultured Roseobacter sp. TaxID=114847 RepID=UPI0026364893|nr:hypothetical protein [uncultured Roseobacter sp.]